MVTETQANEKLTGNVLKTILTANNGPLNLLDRILKNFQLEKYSITA